MIFRFVPIIPLLALILLTACSNHSATQKPSAPRQASTTSPKTNSPKKVFSQWKTSQDGQISLRLITTDQSLNVYDPIEIWIEVRNNGKTDCYVKKPLGDYDGRFYFQIQYPKGKLRKYYANVCGMIGMNAHVRLKSGETHRDHMFLKPQNWPGSVLPCQYKVSYHYNMNKYWADHCQRCLQNQKKKLEKYSQQGIVDRRKNKQVSEIFDPRGTVRPTKAKPTPKPINTRPKAKPKNPEYIIWHGEPIDAGPLVVKKSRKLPANMVAGKWTQSSDSSVAARLLMIKTSSHPNSDKRFYLEIRNESLQNLILLRPSDRYTQLRVENKRVTASVTNHPRYYASDYTMLEPGGCCRQEAFISYQSTPDTVECLYESLPPPAKHIELFRERVTRSYFSRFHQEKMIQKLMRKISDDKPQIWSGKILTTPITLRPRVSDSKHQ